MYKFPFRFICILHVHSFLQVHALFTNCGYGWQGSSCHCGIAIRSRNSLFVLRTCETISRNGKYLLQQPVTELKSCDDSDFIINQYGNEYKVVCSGDFSALHFSFNYIDSAGPNCSLNRIISCYLEYPKHRITIITLFGSFTIIVFIFFKLELNG